MTEWQCARGHGFSVDSRLKCPLFDGSVRTDCKSDALLREPNADLERGLDMGTVFVKDPPEADIRFSWSKACIDAICAKHFGHATGIASHAVAACAFAPWPTRPANAEIEADVSNRITAGPCIRTLRAQGFGDRAIHPLAGGSLSADPAMRG